MRRAYYGTQFIPYEGEIIGICLGYDHCSEHEWGIERLERLLGMQKEQKRLLGLGPKKPVLGIDSKRIHTLDPQHLVYRETLDGDAYLIYWPRFVSLNNDEERVQRQIDHLFNNGSLRFFTWDKKNNQNIIAAWSDSEFGIRVIGNDNVQHLRSIYEALRTNNAVVTLAHTSYPEIFPSGGLYVFIGDKFPEHVDEQIKQDHKSKFALQEAHQKLGLSAELKNKGKTWFALSPRWVKDFRSSVETEHELIYWLNPMKQDIYKAGWFTVEELRQWGDDTGPVIKDQEND